jgi:DNA-binding NarL/FixJ family response regulator
MDKRIAIFDDSDSRREGLEMLIQFTDGLSCVGMFTDCRQVLKDIEQCNPDVVLMDIDMPYVNGIEGVRQIRTKYPTLKILMQTVFENDDKIFDSICAGADGYVLKKTQPADMIKAIFDVLEDGAPMTSSIARKVLQLVGKSQKPQAYQNFQLTPRELEILKHLVEGLSYKMIAAECGISHTTVITHIKHIFEKLQVNNGTAAVAKAIHNKLI